MVAIRPECRRRRPMDRRAATPAAEARVTAEMAAPLVMEGLAVPWGTAVAGTADGEH